MPPKKRTFSFFIFHFLLFILFTSCSIEKQISKSANEDVLSNKALTTAHVGISIFEPAANKYWFNYQGDKYFVPASNTKLPTCYAAMKYLGDSLVGGRISDSSDVLYFNPTGDPTFLHPYFSSQPVLDLLKSYKTIIVCDEKLDDFKKYGPGWSWGDYEESYMPERNRFPLYGNVFTFYRDGDTIKSIPIKATGFPYFKEMMIQMMSVTVGANKGEFKARVWRMRNSNDFHFGQTKSEFTRQQIPFITDDPVEEIQQKLLKDTLGENVRVDELYYWEFGKPKVIHSQPTDSLLKPMMHRSDNFFAEQTLLMISNERLGVMNDEKIIDTLLKTDFKDLPQKPRWVDGSGLSRYNLFTPQDFVAILNKMKNEFGMERLKVILATGGEGTISSYYKADSGFIYGKTGTLSGVVAFSGFLYTKKGKLLIFSTLVNNHQASATDVRRAIEKFLQGIRSSY
jgi:D-alanyl-D-alanine carboxypeptidase/D-alanyl-D-alanine-endopeptidase (penicillin-binding protein 4)